MQMKTIKPEKMSNMDMPSEGYYPHLDLSSDEIPQIKDWEVGKSYKIVLEVKQTSKREDKDKKISACFEVRKVGVEDEAKKELINKVKGM